MQIAVEYGGAIFMNAGASVSIADESILGDNYAGSYGGGIMMLDGTLAITNGSIVRGNTGYVNGVCSTHPWCCRCAIL